MHLTPPSMPALQVWLQNVVDAMRAALSHEFKAAIPTYDEKPRTKWIFDNSVQNTIVVSRTFFTQEVGRGGGSWRQHVAHGKLLHWLCLCSSAASLDWMLGEALCAFCAGIQFVLDPKSDVS